MTTPDLNLLVTLDVLLAEGSVARAVGEIGMRPYEPGHCRHEIHLVNSR